MRDERDWRRTREEMFEIWKERKSDNYFKQRQEKKQLCRCRSLLGLPHPPHEKQQDGYFEIPGLLWGTAQFQVGSFFCQNGWPALWSLPSSKGQTVR